MLSLFLAILPLCLAAPIDGELTTLDNAVGYGTGGGIVGLIVLVLDVLVFSKHAHLSPALNSTFLLR
jgi:hypothetical protein